MSEWLGAAVLRRNTLAWILLLVMEAATAFSPTLILHTRHQRERITSFELQARAIRVAIVGGGWAGFSAATVLADHPDMDVRLLDASPRGPGGLAGAGWATPRLNVTMEAGIHGFWREYRNTYAILEQVLGSKHATEMVLSDYTPSLLVSKQGKVAVAPVLGEESSTTTTPIKNSLLRRIADALPPPLDLALLAEYDPDESNLTLGDRLSALGLLGPWADFQQEDKASWDRYSRISADHLFRDIAGVSKQLYEQLVEPLLHVLPMSTGYDCSAAAALSCFHVFALQSKGAFDVRWCKSGSLAQSIFDPWVQYLQDRGVKIRGSARLESMCHTTSGDTTQHSNYRLRIQGESEEVEVDAVILAIGATAALKLLPSCPVLEQSWNGWQDVPRGISCVALRLVIDVSRVQQQCTESIPPVTVCGPGLVEPILQETGFCIYNLSKLQKAAFPNQDWLVLETDYFRANPLLDRDDETLLRLALDSIQAALPFTRTFDFQNAVLDFGVVRARDAVSHFSVGAQSPPVRLDQTGLYMCGDWIDRSGHASWSTEKAVVTGKQAAGALLEDFATSAQQSPEILPATTDGPALQRLRELAATVRSVIPAGAPAVFPRAPWSTLI